ncbi:MAG: DNA-J related domain-containing protein [Natronospirillum sp.]
MTPDQDVLHEMRAVLIAHPEGLNELAMMNALDTNPAVAFKKPDMSDNWALFQAHFWLFHHLYLLQLAVQEEGLCLEILATRIQLRQPHHSTTGRSDSRTQTELSTGDPMRSYYLDIDQLERETPAGLDAKLNAFWHGVVNPELRQADWRTVDLRPTQSAQVLRDQYRRLCQKHHPDRGGEVKHFQAIQAAYARLKTQMG